MNRKLLTLVLVAGGGCVLRLLGWFTAPQPWQKATGWNCIPEAERPGTSADAPPGEPWIRWLGHSGFVIRWDDTVLLLDPNTSTHCTVSKRILEFPAPVSRLGRVDGALISHAHFDHLNLDTLASIPELQVVLVPVGSEVFFDAPKWTGGRVRPVALGQVQRVGSLEVCAVPAMHNGNRFHPLHSRIPAFGYAIRNAAGFTVYFAGDTAFGNDWAAIRKAWHPDLAILPIGAYAPRIPLKHHHLNPEEAVRAAELLGVKRVIPCHFGTFTLSFDRPQSALPRFARAAALAHLRWSMPSLLREADLPALGATL